MVKKTKKHQSRRSTDIFDALDLMLAGQDAVIGSDFILTRRDPFNADIGHLDPIALRTFDENFVNDLLKVKAIQKAVIPSDLKALCDEYLIERSLLSAYHDDAYRFLINEDIAASKELGNFDPYLEKYVLRNDAEMNLFYDYLALYRKIEKKRSVVYWRHNNPDAINPQNKAVVTAFEKATFAVLRLDENLSDGAIRVTNVITKKESILMDRALYRSKKEGLFFICSLLDRGHYIMTSGGGIPIDAKVSAGKSALTLIKKYVNALAAAKSPLNNNIAACIRDVYGLCLRGGALEHMTVGL